MNDPASPLPMRMERTPVTTISAPTYTVERGVHTLSATVEISGERKHIYFKSSHGPLATGPEPFLVSALLPAMSVGAPLRVESPVSALLLERLDWVQDLVTGWVGDFTRIPIQASAQPVASLDMNRHVGCFFSGGVDSSYTVLKQHAAIDALILVHGFDMPVKNTRLWATVRSAIGQAAGELNKPLIEIETNVRALIEPQVRDWDIGVGAAGASIAYLLSPQLRTVYRAAGVDYAHTRPVARTPLFYQGFNTAHVQILDDGRAATRAQKVQSLVADGRALRWLRVCWENRGGRYNCGRCAKCSDAMINLMLNGALERAATFPHRIDTEAVRRLTPLAYDYSLLKRDLAAVEAAGGYPELAAALRECLGPDQAHEQPDPRAQEQLYVARREIKQLALDLQAMEASHSWRITAPLRAAGRRLRAAR